MKCTTEEGILQQFLDVTDALCSEVVKASGAFAAGRAYFSAASLQALKDACVESTCEAHAHTEACMFLAHHAFVSVNHGANVTWTADPVLSAQCAPYLDKCTNGQVYADCVSHCAPTCQSKGDVNLIRVCDDSPSRFAHCILFIAACGPGCQCPGSHILDENKARCVEEAACSCFDSFTQTTLE